MKEQQPIAHTHVICDITGSQGSGNFFENPINEKIVSIFGNIFYCPNFSEKTNKKRKKRLQ